MYEIKVKVVEFGDRKHFQMQYVDPITRKKKTRSTGVNRDGTKKARADAAKAAGKWEAELREGRYASPSRTTWSSFRERYETEVVGGLSKRTLQQCDVVFDMVERLLNPQRVQDITAQRLSWLVAELRKDSRIAAKKEPKIGKKVETKITEKTKPGLSESSIKSYLAHLKASLRWAERVGIIAKAPMFPKLQRAASRDSAKGRAISGEEFERMLAAVPKIVGAAHVVEWCRYLRGLWLSGFRVGESLALSWDEGAGIVVDISGRNPVAHIAASAQKSNRTETVPLTPDFGALLAETPVDRRAGRVFNPLGSNGKRVAVRTAIRMISDIGKRATVKTWTNPKSGAVKCATAHDLRRSFGTRWAALVMPVTLQQMMRHANYQTTMSYYITKNAETAGDIIRQAAEKLVPGNSFGNTPVESHEKSTHD